MVRLQADPSSRWWHWLLLCLEYPEATANLVSLATIGKSG
ncbi:hypothetical protein BRADI_3g47656v3 [Brachypodium distachyon]|uniref:Uncharacterized protein n=1 Tax=Brachypodium distachyon TaxID=15368 RepID=A0A2K2D3U9_BRADI|nr:hypothetical protein BRADI_3g47656v3 [Brachypodium distachyon]